MEKQSSDRNAQMTAQSPYRKCSCGDTRNCSNEDARIVSCAEERKTALHLRRRKVWRLRYRGAVFRVIQFSSVGLFTLPNIHIECLDDLSEVETVRLIVDITSQHIKQSASSSLLIGGSKCRRRKPGPVLKDTSEASWLGVAQRFGNLLNRHVGSGQQ